MSEPTRVHHDCDQPLSQNQVETLLKAMETVEPRAGTNHPSTAASVVDPLSQKELPSSIEPSLLSAMGVLHDSVAGNLTQSLSSLLRTSVQVHVDSVQQISVHQFEQQSDRFRWLTVLTSEVGNDHWLLDVPPELCCVIVDRMLGGDPTPGETFTRSLTDIERRLVQRFVDDLLHQLQREWMQVAELRWNVCHQDETLPRSANSDQSLVEIRFAISISHNAGMFRFAIPVTAIDSLGSRLSDDGWRQECRASNRNQSVAAAPIDVAVTLTSTTISTSDLLELNVGDVIATEKEASELLDLSVQSIPKFKVRPGALRGKKAVQLDSIIDEQAQQ